MNTKPWIVKTCLLENLEATMNEIETSGYVIEKYEAISESFHWIVIAHMLTEEV
jgi:hypothetical protein